MKKLFVLIPLLLGACSHVDKERQDQNICAEYRDIVCVTSTLCDYDEKKRCKVCRCDCISGNCQENMLTNPDLPKNTEPLR